MSPTVTTRRGRLAWWVFVLLLVVPLAEVLVIVSVGRVIGTWPTLALLLAESALGAWLVRREGARAWHALRDALRTGRMPSTELADGILVLVGGTLLLTPGFLSDVAGFAAVLPVTRPLARGVLARAVARRLLAPGAATTGPFVTAGFTVPGAGTTAPGWAAPQGSRASTGASRGPRPEPGTTGPDGVIEGEIL